MPDGKEKVLNNVYSLLEEDIDQLERLSLVYFQASQSPSTKRICSWPEFPSTSSTRETQGTLFGFSYRTSL